MGKKVVYQPEQLIAASRYLEENHGTVKRDSQDWYDFILSVIRDSAKRESTFTITGGFMIVFDYDEEDNTLYAEVFVEPCLTNEEIVFDSFNLEE